jgi:type VI secretion system secreted protein VgrG
MATPVGGSRGLTDGEKRMAKDIFGHSIDYSKVLIRNEKWGFFTFFLSDRLTVTPDGTMYCGPESFREDFAADTVEMVFHFIHEMVHVWQYQLGFQVKGQGIASVFRYGYKYTLKPDSKLSDFPMEGQGNIIADYSMYVFYHAPVYYSGKRYGKAPYTFAELQAVLADFIANPSDPKNLPTLEDSQCKDPASAVCINR